MAIELVNHSLKEYTGNQQWMTLLSNVKNASSNADGSTHVQIGSYIQADVSTKLDPPSGSVVLAFNNVTISYSKLISDFMSSAASSLQRFTQPLEPIYNLPNKKLISAGPESLTTLNLPQDAAMDSGRADI